MDSVIYVHGSTDDDGDGEDELFRLKITRVRLNADGTADYSVDITVDRQGAVGMYRRVVYGFPHNEYNALGLLRLALHTLDTEELRLEHPTPAPDLARRLSGPGD